MTRPAEGHSLSMKREKIGAGSSARYVRRDEQGRFTSDQVNVGRSLATDRRTQAKTTAKPGYGDKGDRKRRPS
jgi:hypothetical protein